MAELKSMMGIKDVRSMQSMNNEQWERMYDDGMLSLEKLAPFEHQIETPPYRFKWVLEKASGEGKSLDIGCNNGSLAYLLNMKGFEVIGLDVGDKLLAKCVENVPEGKFIKAFADQEIPFPSNHFQIVTALEVLEHVQNPEKMVQEMVRVLKPGGKLMATVPVGKAYDCPQHLRYFDFYKLGELFEPFVDKFKICRIYKSGTADRERKLYAIEVTK